MRNRFLMPGAPDVRALDPCFAALVRNHFAEHRGRRATREASRTLQENLRRKHHEADHAERSRSADPALWLRQALDLIALQWIPHERPLLFDGAGLGWMRGALDLLLRRYGCTATTDIAAGLLGQSARRRAFAIATENASRPLGAHGCTREFLTWQVS
jgi:hypothetical protein